MNILMIISINYVNEISEAEPGRYVGGLRRRGGGEPEVCGEEKREPPKQQVPGARELMLQVQVRDWGVVRPAQLRGLRREAAAGGGDQTQGGLRQRSGVRKGRFPAGGAAGIRCGGGHGLAHSPGSDVRLLAL